MGEKAGEPEREPTPEEVAAGRRADGKPLHKGHLFADLGSRWLGSASDDVQAAFLKDQMRKRASSDGPPEAGGVPPGSVDDGEKDGNVNDDAMKEDDAGGVS